MTDKEIEKLKKKIKKLKRDLRKAEITLRSANRRKKRESELIDHL